MEDKDKLSRRDFIRNATKVTAGIAFSTATIIDDVEAEETENRKLDLPDDIVYVESHCGKGTDKRILVVYASMYGTTGGIAKVIGEELCGEGAIVDVKYVNNVEDISSYDAVVIGSAIRGSEWLHEAVDFVRQHRIALSQIPVAYFLACMTLAKTKNPEHEKEMRERAASWLVPVYEEIPEVKPIGVGLFAGAIYFDRMPAIQRILYPVIAGNDFEGDFRKWDKIKAWVRGIRPAIIS